jgi:hypothetical protein
MYLSDLIDELTSIKKDYGNLPVNKNWLKKKLIELKVEDDNLIIESPYLIEEED